MVVNDNATNQTLRGDPGIFASRLAPTGYAVFQLERGFGISRPRCTAGRARKRSSTRVTFGKF
ncbi:hypothetical protein PS918_00124 [Pseudomonas fluorescens]|uniref:Uncharacterized protein n=1 Tax=Pseudomonas fluorescens TaxID=294 RepID=A0A5E7QU88_PSEFL|nr:hypothetical protein PS918_00124 [Pseudomonas fluorescens]